MIPGHMKKEVEVVEDNDRPPGGGKTDDCQVKQEGNRQILMWTSEMFVVTLQHNISSLKSLILKSCSPKHFHLGLLCVLLVVTKAESNRCQLPLKTTKEDSVEEEEAAERLAAAQEFSTDATVWSLLSKLDLH